MSRRPNILVLMADQLTPLALPAYGNRVARTPHMDALAEAGVVVQSAYCNSPLCGPSRVSFMTGRLPSATGAFDNACPFPSDIPTFAHYLRLAGYRTILTGKMHFCGADQLHGFEERLTTDIYPADFGWTPDWSDPQARPEWYHSMDSVAQAGLCVRTNQIDFDEEVTFTACRKLFDIARGSDDRPFCLVISLTHPHDPFAIPKPYWDRYDHAAIDMPRVPPPGEPDPHSLRLRHVCGIDTAPPTEQQIRAARHAYYGAVSYVDDHVGLIMETLHQTGHSGDTVTLLLADHGEMLGERGLWYKMNFFEPSVRVPMIVHAPGMFAPRRAACVASLADVLPTLAEIAGDGRAPDYATPLDGCSLLPRLGGMVGDEVVLSEYLAEGTAAPIVMIRRGAQKLIHCPTDPDQLFNLADDPDELRNLAAGDAALPWREEVARRWDLDALHRRVVESQQRRRVVAAALRQGRAVAWDFQPVEDASRRYVRSHMTLDEVEAMARFPRVAPPGPSIG